MRIWWLRGAVMAGLLCATVASSDTSPQVVIATPGAGGGAIERFTMRFSEAMVPLGDPRAAAPVDIVCPVAGQGRWVDQATFVYAFAGPLPGGISCSFDLRKGLTSARGADVGGQRHFTVDTGGPTARAVLPAQYGGEIEEDQVFLVAPNVAVDRASVAANAYCAVDGIGEKIAVDLLAPDVPSRLLGALDTDRYEVSQFLSDGGLPAALPESAADRATALQSVIALKCRRPLPPGHDMALVWAGAIRSPNGRTAGADQRYDFTVRKAFEARFECGRVNPQAGCNPVSPAYVRFTAPVPRATALAVRLDLGDGKLLVPTVADENRNDATLSDLTFAAPLPQATTARVQLPAGIRDESGRPLANAERFPLEVRFDAAPPLVKFAADFGILEAAEGGVLAVTVRAVEPALGAKLVSVGGRIARMPGGDGQIADWLRRLAKAAENDYREEGPEGKTHSVNYTGATALLNGAAGARPLNVALPGKGKAFEVVGIPLGKPGFYVVELASPALGRALLGRNQPRYVAAGALVTNMAVHFKWGRGASLAWVTQLDSGKPVAGAAVRVTDSCSGKTLAQGTSDATGRVLVATGLPEPETYGNCDEGSPAPLMVSARKADDFSFTLTSWGDGIAPTDFDLPYGYSAPDDILQTIFDRTLIRAGETVHMKHILRRPLPGGFGIVGLTGTLRLQHRGSDTQFDLPITIGADGVGETAWTAPKGAPMGDYDLQVITGSGDTAKTLYTSQSVRVDEYRLPTMRAAISGPKTPAVRPKSLPLDLYVGYLSGGGASGLPVRVRAAFDVDASTPKGWDGWTFGGRDVTPGIRPLDGDGQETRAPLPSALTLPVTLDKGGAARTAIDIPATLDGQTAVTVEMDYADANGEILTASNRVPIYPSAVRLGIKTDGWLMKQDDLRLRLVALGLDGEPIRGQKVHVDLYSREILSARRRLIGGFYAYDNNARTTKIDADCDARTDDLGRALCKIDPGVSGEVYAVATTKDADGNVSRAVTSVWLAGDDEWWFGGDNGDRMDLVPERVDYKAGETARFQVRMPFRSATALVTVEREGVLSSFVTTLSGTDPVVEVPMPSAYAPDVFVSVLAVRGRIAGWRLWLADFARRWHLPFFSREGATPTALVDLAKPSYRLGIARVNVGWEGHTLAVTVKPDRDKYHVRDTAQVAVQVTAPGGKPPASAEIAFAAVDEAILQLSPNDSWQLLDAMMGDRPLAVLTSSAQTQVVGKRHYGKKAVAAGGGGGDLSAVNRENFQPVLLWRGRVPLDAQGRAHVAVPLSDALSSFRLVAIATAGPDLFGTGDASIRTVQDLSVYPGVPPLVRSGDWYGATFTLRNGSDKPMTVTANATVSPAIGRAPPLTVTIPAGGAVPVTWNLTAPVNIDRLAWTVTARSADGRAADTVTVAETVVPAIPVETWAATLVHVGGAPIPITPPAGAIPGRGGVEVKLTDTLAPPLDGVRDYMRAYPYECLEQQTSRAVALGDAGMFARTAGDLPAYLDTDGLARYFPMDALRGSDSLTAYLLSITAEAGFVLPEGPKAKMIEALKAVVDGRLTRESAWAGDTRLSRLAALAALARNGASNAAMLGQIGLAPAEMPTSALTDWIVALDRTPGADPAQRAAAEAALRTRLVYEGSRLDLTDAGAAPWWMMTSSDEMALRALMVTLGRPGWGEEAPRMMVGAALRQRRGHWDTTPANAWGALVARKFAGIYKPADVAGTTRISLAGALLTRVWPQPVDAPLLRLPLPRGVSPLLLAQEGGAGPWAQVAVKAAVPLSAPSFTGYRIARAVSIVEQRHAGRLTRGDTVRVRLTVDSAADRNWVVVNDPIPAGATIVGSLGGQSAMLASGETGDGVSPSYVERGQDGWRGYFEWLPRGRTVVEYTVRLNGAGRFQLPPTKVEAMYSPDIRGLLPNQMVTVTSR